jgi:peptide/nickel transport system substrate-binding protein
VDKAWAIQLMRLVIPTALLLSAIILLGIFAGPALRLSPGASAVSNSSFTVGTLLGGEQVTNLNPLSNSAGGIESDVTGVIYSDSMLMEFDNGSYIPWTASSWSVSNNGLTLTFNLVHNASWVNGTTVVGPFTAQDVVFTFNVLKANSTLDINGIDPYLQNVTAPNNYTVVFQLTQPNLMAFYYIGGQTIIPALWQSYESNLSDIGDYLNMNIGHEITLGPMSLQSISGNYITYVANPTFFLGTPHFQSEIWEQFTSTSSQIDSLKTGAIQATYVDSNSVYPSLQNISGVQTVVFKDTFNLDLWFDDRVAPYNNTDFRIGLAYLLNDSEIVQKAEDGLGGLTNSGGLPWTLSQYYNETDPAYNNNVTIANQYFQMAGMSINNSTGFWQYANGTTVSIKMLDIPQSDWDTSMTLIQSALTADNFETDLSIVPTGTWASEIFSVTDFPYLSYFNFGPLFANPWFDLWALYDGSGYWNFEHYNNTEVNQLFNQSETLVNNPTQLNATLQKIQGIVSAQLPVIPVMGSDLFFGYRSDQIGGVYPGVQMSSPLDSLYVYPVNSSPNSSSTTTSANTYYIIVGVVVVIVAVAAIVGVVMRRNRVKKE